ncbi:hypothetical protein KY346_04280 [Candidatus Woesearchaeota archaeon]|nr:hypothetical protein [Candidatus Woesearchaeota archaeon]
MIPLFNTILNRIPDTADPHMSFWKSKVMAGIVAWSFLLNTPLFLHTTDYQEKLPVVKREYPAVKTSETAKEYCERIFSIYDELYPPLSSCEKKDLLGKIDADKDGVISDLEALVVLDKLNKELEKALRY